MSMITIGIVVLVATFVQLRKGLSSSASSSSFFYVFAQKTTAQMTSHNSSNNNYHQQRFLVMEEEEDLWSNYYSGSIYIDYGPNGHPYDHANSNGVDNLEEQQQHGHRKETQTSSYTYQPIRINFATDPIDSLRGQSNNIDKQIDNILTNILPVATNIWAGHLAVIPLAGYIAINRTECLGKFSDTLRSQTFNEADLALIVDGKYTPSCRSGALAYASVCATDQFGRPIIGFMNFCLLDNTTYAEAGNSSSTSTAAQDNQNYNTRNGQSSDDGNLLMDIIQSQYSQWTNKTFRSSDIDISIEEVVVHEMGHALGVFSPLFPYYRNKDNGGIPYTELNGDGSLPTIAKLCINGTTLYGEYPSDSVVKTVESTTHPDIYYQYIVTPRVAQVARNFFNCSTMMGARLAYDYGSCIGSHWHERILYTELLSPVVSSIGENVLSPFTLALLEDSGWYQVDYYNSEMPAYGSAGGCDFVTNDCIVNELIPSYVNGEFCNQLLEVDTSLKLVSETALDHVFCEPSYRSWAACDLFQFISSAVALPPGNEAPIYYFGNSYMRPQFTDADTCPIPSVPLGLDCRKTQQYNPFYPGEKVGPSSRCLNSFYNNSVNKVYQPSCMEVICDEISNDVIIKVDTTYVTCQYSHQEILIPGTSNGYIICPRLASLCPKIFQCPYACSGRGTCIYPAGVDSVPYCQCFDSSTTDPACSPPEVVALRNSRITPTLPPTPPPTSAPTISKGAPLTTMTPTSMNRIVNPLQTLIPTESFVNTESPRLVLVPTTKTSTPDKNTNHNNNEPQQVGFRPPTKFPSQIKSASVTITATLHHMILLSSVTSFFCWFALLESSWVII